MCTCDPSVGCLCSVQADTQVIETPTVNLAKVYSLDTFRRARTMMAKQDAIRSSKITKQEDLDTHYNNIDYIKDNRFIGG